MTTNNNGYQRTWTAIAAFLTATAVTLTLVNTVMSRDREVTSQIAVLSAKVELMSDSMKDIKASLASFEERMDKVHTK